MREYIQKIMKQVLAHFKFSVPSVTRINAILGVKAQDQWLLKIFIRFFPAIGVLVSPVNVKSTLSTIRQMFHLVQTMNKVGLVKYLKVCSVCLQQCIGGHVLSDVGELGMRISRTDSGIPRIIPIYHRNLIRQGNPFIIRLYLTLFALYRVINIPAKVKLGSITDPFKGTNETIVDHWIPNFQRVFVDPAFRHIDIYAKLRSYGKIFIIWKSSAGTSNSEGPNPFATHPITIVKTGLGMLMRQDMRQALFAWFYASRLSDGSWVFKWFSPLMPELISSNLRSIWMSIIRILDNCSRKQVRSFGPVKRLGKLALKHEPAGKMRVFAMVDPFTQWALYPLHKVILYIIRRYSMDGTFNQVKPLGHMVKAKQLYSLDLSSATDRLPISLQVKILSCMLKDSKLAESWKTLLVGRTYSVPFGAGSSLSEVTYAVGQPMGALSSWAMLALTHHFIVQCAAWNCGHTPPSRLYKNYALLGDDLVLGNHEVMISYLRILEGLGVECGLHKSVVSHAGLSLEFAKRTYFKGMDVSPISLTEFIASCSSISEMISFARKYQLGLAQIARALGYGWRVISSTNKPLGSLNAVLRGISIASILPDSPAQVQKFFASGKAIREDISNFIFIFVQYEFSKIREDLRKQINEDAKIDWSYLPILAQTRSYFQFACLEVINKLLYPARMRAITEAEDLVQRINVCSDKHYSSLEQMFLEYLEILKSFTLISRSSASLTLKRTPTIRGKSPILLKMWNRWSPIFQGKSVNFNTYFKTNKVHVSKPWIHSVSGKQK